MQMSVVSDHILLAHLLLAILSNIKASATVGWEANFKRADNIERNLCHTEMQSLSGTMENAMHTLLFTDVWENEKKNLHYMSFMHISSLHYILCVDSSLSCKTLSGDLLFKRQRVTSFM